MEVIMKNYSIIFLSLLLITIVPTTKADDMNDAQAISSCLNSWGKHPFGDKPDYKTMDTSVKVFGLGKNPVDSDKTDKPALILLNPAVNVMGKTIYELLNPNGWYCFKSNVNVMGGLIIKADCKAHLASAKTGATVLGDNNSNKGVTVMGQTKIELLHCN